MNRTGPVQMICPACKGASFMVEFLDEMLIAARGSVRVTCIKCGGRWTGSISLDKGYLPGPCCAEGYEEDEDV